MACCRSRINYWRSGLSLVGEALALVTHPFNTPTPALSPHATCFLCTPPPSPYPHLPCTPGPLPSFIHKRKSPRLSPPCLCPTHLFSALPPLPSVCAPASTVLPCYIPEALLTPHRHCSLHLPQQLSVASDFFSLSSCMLWLSLNNSCSKLTLHFVIFFSCCFSFILDIWICSSFLPPFRC